MTHIDCQRHRLYIVTQDGENNRPNAKAQLPAGTSDGIARSIYVAEEKNAKPPVLPVGQLLRLVRRSSAVNTE